MSIQGNVNQGINMAALLYRMSPAYEKKQIKFRDARETLLGMDLKDKEKAQLESLRDSMAKDYQEYLENQRDYQTQMAELDDRFVQDQIEQEELAAQEAQNPYQAADPSKISTTPATPPTPPTPTEKATDSLLRAQEARQLRNLRRERARRELRGQFESGNLSPYDYGKAIGKLGGDE